MKRHRLFILASLLITNSALSITPAEIAALKDQSQAQATIESAKDKITRAHLRHEIDLLLLDLHKKQKSMIWDKRIERVSVVISAGLAATLGYTAFKPVGAAEGNALIDIGERWVIGTITSAGIATSLSAGGLSAYLVNVNPAQITLLRNKLLTAKAQLEAADKE